MKIVIVGQAPGPNSGRRPFDGRSGDRLARYMGLPDREALRGRADLLNVLPRYPGPEGAKGDLFPREEARAAARRLSKRLEGRTVVFAGKRVGAAFGVRTPFLKWVAHDAGFRAVVIPHPSGVNQWWNDPANRAKFTKFARSILETA